MKWEEVEKTFQRIWGYDSFRPPQGEIVRSLLEGKDSLIILPTGMGKSICFQLPALLQTGLTLVISPLVALMENQVQELRAKQIPAAVLHSQLSRQYRKQVLQQIQQHRLRLLYLSPETFLSLPVWEILKQETLKINGLILDEAHCLVQWGETFRPDYRRLGIARQTLLQHKPPGSKIVIAAFTATANPHAQTVIKNTLALQDPVVFRQNPYRSNLTLNIKTIWTPRGRKRELIKFLQQQGKTTGLVYVRTRRDSEALSQFLQEKHYQTLPYHGGLSPQSRRQIEAQWLNGDLPFVICTNAFGMGINKPDVRWVIHYQAPQLLSEYIQEIGRGGRDGNPSTALTLMSEPTGWLNPEDHRRNQFFFKQLKQQYQKAEKIAQQLPKQGNLMAVSQEFKQGKIALSLLHYSGLIQWKTPFEYERLLSSSPLNLSTLLAIQEEAYQEMSRYFTTKTCRWQYLLKSFGFPQEAVNFHCGHCDNCG